MSADVKYPQLRRLLVDALEKLADPAFQRRVLLDRENKERHWQWCFDEVVDTLFDDQDYEHDPLGTIGVIVRDERELSAVLDVVEAIDAVIAVHGHDLSDAEYVALPEWGGVVGAARKACATMATFVKYHELMRSTRDVLDVLVQRVKQRVPTVLGGATDASHLKAADGSATPDASFAASATGDVIALVVQLGRHPDVVRCAVDLCREGTVLSQMHTWEIRWNGDQLDASLFLAALREYVLAQEDTVVQQLAQPDLS